LHQPKKVTKNDRRNLKRDTFVDRSITRHDLLDCRPDPVVTEKQCASTSFSQMLRQSRSENVLLSFGSGGIAVVVGEDRWEAGRELFSFDGIVL
jgi:hypothetical protein